MNTVKTVDNCYSVKKANSWRLQSNFNLKLVGEISHSADTIYLAEVERDDGAKGQAAFAISDVFQVHKFTRALNRSFPGGGLMCFMKPETLQQVILKESQEMKTKVVNYSRQLISVAGIQPGSDYMILSRDQIVDLKTGTMVDKTDCPYTWVTGLQLKDVPSANYEHTIQQPVSIKPLQEFLDLASDVLQNNFAAALLAWSSLYSMNFYKWVLQMNRQFNLPVLYGQPMVGKTLIAMCGAWLMGSEMSHIGSRCTLTFITNWVTHSTIPFIWDDPAEPSEVEKLSVELGNGAVRGKSGKVVPPTTGCLVTSNFDLSNMLKFFSRILLLKLEPLDNDKRPGDARRLELKAAEASAALPLVLQVLHHLDENDVFEEMNRLQQIAGFELRMVGGIALQLHVTRQILNLSNRYHLMGEVMNYVVEKIIPYYQTCLDKIPVSLELPVATPATLDDLGLNLTEINSLNSVVVSSRNGLEFGFKQSLLKRSFDDLKRYRAKRNVNTRIAGRCQKAIRLPVSSLCPDALADIETACRENNTAQRSEVDNIPPPLEVPAAQPVNDNIPPPHEVPAAQGVNDNIPQPHEVPAAQRVTDNIPPPIEVLDAQQVNDNIPPPLEVPAAQQVNDNIPTPLEVPAAQRLTDNIPPPLEVPAAQRVTDNIPPPLEVPAAQQVNDNIQRPLEVPAAQQVHDNIQRPLEVPAAQQVTDNIPPPLEVPASQQVDDNIPPPLEVPAAQQVTHNIPPPLEVPAAQRVTDNILPTNVAPAEKENLLTAVGLVSSTETFKKKTDKRRILREKKEAQKKTKLDKVLSSLDGTVKEVCQTCQKCGRSGQLWLQCDLCDRWFHRSCLSMPRKYYMLLQQENSAWKCNKCSQ